MTDDGHTTTNDDQIAIDSSVLFDHKKELDHLFRMYIEDINPFIVRFETAKTEFPIEIQNEIRAIYGHLVRASMSTDKKLVSLLCYNDVDGEYRQWHRRRHCRGN